MFKSMPSFLSVRKHGVEIPYSHYTRFLWYESWDSELKPRDIKFVVKDLHYFCETTAGLGDQN